MDDCNWMTAGRRRCVALPSLACIGAATAGRCDELRRQKTPRRKSPSRRSTLPIGTTGLPRAARAGSRLALSNLRATYDVDDTVVLFMTGELVHDHRFDTRQIRLGRPGSGPRVRVGERVLVPDRVRGDPCKALHDAQIVAGSVHIRSRRSVLEIRRLHDERIPFPPAAGVTPPMPDARRHWWTAVERNDAHVIVRLVDDCHVARALEEQSLGRHTGGEVLGVGTRIPALDERYCRFGQ